MSRRETPQHERRNPWRRGLAWLIAAITVVLLGYSLVLRTRSGPGLTVLGEVGGLNLLSPFISVLIGALVIDRKGNHPVGWMFCLSGLGWGLYEVGFVTGFYSTAGQTSPGQDAIIWLTTWASMLAFGLTPVLVVYLFPNGKLPGPGWRWAFRGAIVAVVNGAVSFAFAPGPYYDLPALVNPYGLKGVAGDVMTVLTAIAWPLLLTAVIAGVVSLRQRSRSASLEERQQIKWLLLAGLTLVAFLVFWSVNDIMGQREVAAAVAGLFLPVLPIALGIAILRHRLYDIDVLINRTLVYGSLSAVLALVYLGTVVVSQRVLSAFTTDSNIAIAASTLAVAALFRPVRARIQQFIDRRFYRQKYDAMATVGRFSTQLRHEVDLDALQDELLAAVGQALQPDTAAVWLRSTEPAR